MFIEWDKWKEVVFKYKGIFICSALILLFICLYFAIHLTKHETDNNPNLTRDDAMTFIGDQSNNKQQKSSVNTTKEKNKSSEIIYVDIKGAVENPNIYKMNSTDRVKQLLDKAKLSTDADLSHINLAEKLQDQKLIYIPKKGEVENIQSNALSKSENGHHQSQSITNTNQEKVNLNSADESQLLKVNGIGPSKAKSIIEYREQHGQFENVDQLKEVNGIGEKTLEKIREDLTV
ncbi:helix-hairpin-helix domain-containing protein [Staphylococcus caeli]|uniref:helix-hairpin-helix domain-containing protein n=1 Tax=Staphylococcus caeli TaxID=2201815 RepID=UPI003F54CC61